MCLGMFMPLGLGVVARLSPHPDEFVAWSWAVNGFFSVIGSVLTIILAMSIGFRAVQGIALAIYGVAVLAFLALAPPRRRGSPRTRAPADDPPPAVAPVRRRVTRAGTVVAGGCQTPPL